MDILLANYLLPKWLDWIGNCNKWYLSIKSYFFLAARQLLSYMMENMIKIHKYEFVW
jgi:hypothetical protein